jgi:hypothetical protein
VTTLKDVEDRIASATGTPVDSTMRRVIGVAHAHYYGLGLPSIEGDVIPEDYPYTPEELRSYQIDDDAGDLIVGWASA